MLFHKLGCVFLGLRVHTIGEPLHNRPTLLLSNHISWTDIIAIGSVADVTFVAKTGVRNTFFVGFMASLQRTLFVDYNRRQDAKRTSDEMAQRLAGNGAVLLFAEGHRDLGTHVQPFRSALVGAAQAAMERGRRQGRRHPAGHHRLHPSAGPAGEPQRAQRHFRHERARLQGGGRRIC